VRVTQLLLQWGSLWETLIIIKIPPSHAWLNVVVCPMPSILFYYYIIALLLFLAYYNCVFLFSLLCLSCTLAWLSAAKPNWKGKKTLMSLRNLQGPKVHKVQFHWYQKIDGLLILCCLGQAHSEHIKVFLLPLNGTAELTSKSKFHQLFNIVYISNRSAHLLMFLWLIDQTSK